MPSESATRSARRREMRTGRGDGAGHGRGHASGLELSEEQLTQMKEIRESYAAEMDELRQALQDGSLTGDEVRARRDEIREAIHTALTGILTEEQLAAWNAAYGPKNESFEGEGRPSREEAGARREEHHQALLDILDDDQEEVWILHRSLSQLVVRSRAGDGPEDGGRRGRSGGRGFGGPPAGT